MVAQLPVLAQAVQRGPDFEIGGFRIFQLNDGDSRFDPYVVQQDFNYGAEIPQREGLIDVRLTVTADGTVTNVENLGGFYDENFLKEAMQGITGTTFNPATEGEQPVQWTQFDMRILLRGMFAAGIKEERKQDYATLLEMISASRFEEAESFAMELLKEKTTLLFEYAYLQDQLATIYMDTGRLHEALVASRHATALTKPVVPVVRADSRMKFSDDFYPAEFLPAASYISALRKRVLIALASNQTGEALRSYELLVPKVELTGDKTLLADLQPKIDELKQALASDQQIGSVIKLVQGVWIYPLSNRRTVGVTGLQGKVDFLDIDCKGATKRRLPFQNESEWKIPESWGTCSLEFRGEPDSQFTMYEFLD
jgi:hypothetical protein